MNLYLIEQGVKTDYDTYDSAVVCAESPEKAVRISPEEDLKRSDVKECWVSKSPNVEETEIHTGAWANELRYILCTYLGEAKEGLKEGLIIASFNAG